MISRKKKQSITYSPRCPLGNHEFNAWVRMREFQEHWMASYATCNKVQRIRQQKQNNSKAATKTRKFVQMIQYTMIRFRLKDGFDRKSCIICLLIENCSFKSKTLKIFFKNRELFVNFFFFFSKIDWSVLTKQTFLCAAVLGSGEKWAGTSDLYRLMCSLLVKDEKCTLHLICQSNVYFVRLNNVSRQINHTSYLLWNFKYLWKKIMFLFVVYS